MSFDIINREGNVTHVRRKEAPSFSTDPVKTAAVMLYHNNLENQAEAQRMSRMLEKEFQETNYDQERS